MDVTWHIRKACPADADGLASCMKSAYTPYLERMAGQHLPPMDVDYLSEIKSYPTWVVEAGEEIIGGLIMVFDSKKASIGNIAVNPSFQGQGIGGALLKLAEREAIEKSFTDLYLATHVRLNENISLYEHLGWGKTGMEGSRVFMHKKL